MRRNDAIASVDLRTDIKASSRRGLFNFRECMIALKAIGHQE